LRILPARNGKPLRDFLIVLALCYILKTVDGADNGSFAVLERLDVNKRDAAQAVRSLNVDLLLTHGNAGAQHIGDGALMVRQQTAVGTNIRNDPQNRSLGSPSLGRRPHSSAARRLYRTIKPSRSQRYTAKGSCSKSRAGNSKGCSSRKPKAKLASTEVCAGWRRREHPRPDACTRALAEKAA
jgi:hypothetical protein